MQVRRRDVVGAVVVALVGDLTVETSAAVRRDVAAAIADAPALVVLDLSGVGTVDLVGTSVVVEAAREARTAVAVPGGRGGPDGSRDDTGVGGDGSTGENPQPPRRVLVVAGPTGRLAEALRRAQLAQLVPVVTDVETALAHAATDPEWRRESVTLPHDVSAASRARNVVRDVCVRWRVRDLGEDAALVASELVTNAIRHARSAPTLQVELASSTLVIEVGDANPSPPRLGTPDPAATGGRGLRLVEHLAERWGVRPEAGGGKTVWCELTL